MATTDRFMVLISVVAVIGTLTGCGMEHNHASCDHDHGTHAAKSAESHAAHNHSDEGPHGGHLIELGHGHAYHAELIENDATESVIVYILDTHMVELPIEQETIFLNVFADGQANAYQLTAADRAGKSRHSRFESTDEKLFQTLEQHSKLTGKLRVTIKGVPYVGHIAKKNPVHGHSKQTR